MDYLNEFIKFIFIPALIITTIIMILFLWLTPLCTTTNVLLGVCI